jgi:hypothetical protein
VQTVSLIDVEQFNEAITAYNEYTDFANAHNAALRTSVDGELPVADVVKTLAQLVRVQHKALGALIEVVRPLLTQQTI